MEYDRSTMTGGEPLGGHNRNADTDQHHLPLWTLPHSHTILTPTCLDANDIFVPVDDPSDELMDTWTEDRHAACAYLSEILGEDYPLHPDEDDPVRQRAEQSLVRRPMRRGELTAQEAADLLDRRLQSRFPNLDEWCVEWREAHGVRGLRVLWARGPSWLTMRAYCDTYAAVVTQGLYAGIEAIGAQPIADYVFCLRYDEQATVDEPWQTWGRADGPREDEWSRRLRSGMPATAGWARPWMGQES